MSRTFLCLAFVGAVLLTVSALPVCMMDVVADAQMAVAGDAVPDVLVKLSRGVADPPAHPSESQRRVEAPERLESPTRQLVATSGPAPRSATSPLGRFALRTAAPTDSTASTPLHLRHCIFLC